MYQCKKCKEVKFAWHFSKIWYDSEGGSVFKRTNLCKKCAKEIADNAVYIAQQSLSDSQGSPKSCLNCKEKLC
jgi:hypothetical protein